MASWKTDDEDGCIKQINQIVKLISGATPDYVLASEVDGLRFIQITCKKVKGKNKFTFTE